MTKPKLEFAIGNGIDEDGPRSPGAGHASRVLPITEIKDKPSAVEPTWDEKIHKIVVNVKVHSVEGKAFSKTVTLKDSPALRIAIDKRRVWLRNKKLKMITASRKGEK